MDYETAKKLKDAGFPQTTGRGFYLAPDSITKWDEATVSEDAYVPTLSELISELGDKFGVLDHFKDGTFGAYIPNDIGTNGLGATPDIAVANLYLAVHPNAADERSESPSHPTTL